jgi:hypothetical protein
MGKMNCAMPIPHGRNRLRQRLFVVKLDSKRIAITGKEAFSQMTMS